MTNIESAENIDLKGRMLICPAQGKNSTFQLVDESGAGEPYAGLAYEVVDCEGLTYSGFLDVTGTGRITNHCAGPIALIVNTPYQGINDYYNALMIREHYPLKITELQVRAERTRYINKDGSRTQHNPLLLRPNMGFYQLEVCDLVEHVSHLPPEVERYFPPCKGARQVMGKHGRRGVCMESDRHTVLQIRPLRALRPMLSTDPQFCALNLYQLALMATLSYCPFGQAPVEHPIHLPYVRFPQTPSSGNWFGDALAKFEELWRVDAGQTEAYYPLYEEVAYSKRLEIVPFDPGLYGSNDPQHGPDQESPIKVHFLDDRGQIVDTNTQAFVAHNDEVILISVRGTSEMGPDALRDIDAFQVPFDGGEGAVHRGFYQAARQAYDFAYKYLDKFYTGQKLLICGHSLGGAIALLLAEMLRRRPGFTYDIVLYTYGAPRAADATFVDGAKPLVHHRMVNHNDPVPSVPATWMKLKPADFGRGAGLRFIGVPIAYSAFLANMINWKGEPYTHHGQLQHFMPVAFGAGEVSHILWAPSCDTLTQHAACTVALAQYEGLPRRDGMFQQVLNSGDHSMTHGYVPNSWATLRRWQEALATQRPPVTGRELERMGDILVRIERQITERRSLLDRDPDQYVRATEMVSRSLILEASRIRMTLERLHTLSHHPLNPADVYGHHAADLERLTENVERWQAHAENTREVQMAMAPKGMTMAEFDVEMGFARRIGAPYRGDILDIS